MHGIEYFPILFTSAHVHTPSISRSVSQPVSESSSAMLSMSWSSSWMEPAPVASSEPEFIEPVGDGGPE